MKLLCFFSCSLPELLNVKIRLFIGQSSRSDVSSVSLQDLGMTPKTKSIHATCLFGTPQNRCPNPRKLSRPFPNSPRVDVKSVGGSQLRLASRHVQLHGGLGLGGASPGELPDSWNMGWYGSKESKLNQGSTGFDFWPMLPQGSIWGTYP